MASLRRMGVHVSRKSETLNLIPNMFNPFRITCSAKLGHVPEHMLRYVLPYYTIIKNTCSNMFRNTCNAIFCHILPNSVMFPKTCFVMFRNDTERMLAIFCHVPEHSIQYTSAIGATSDRVKGIRISLEFKTIINIGSTIIL